MEVPSKLKIRARDRKRKEANEVLDRKQTREVKDKGQEVKNRGKN